MLMSKYYHILYKKAEKISSNYIESVNRTYQIHPMPNLRNTLQLGSERNADAMCE